MKNIFSFFLFFLKMQTIPAQLRYSGVVAEEAIKGTVERSTFFPESSGSFSTNANRVIRIPISNNRKFLDTSRSRLHMKLTVATADAPVYLKSAYSLFSRLRILSSSGTPLEDINQYGLIVNKYLDHLISPAPRSGLSSTHGFSSASTAITKLGPDVVNETEKVDFMTSFPTTGGSATFDIDFPLSGILGITTKQNGVYWPLPFSGEIFLELTLRDSVTDIFICPTGVVGTSVSLTLNEVYYSACLIDYGGEVLTALQQQVLADPTTGGKMVIKADTIVSQDIAISNQFSPIVSVRAKSIKGVGGILRNYTSLLTNDYDASAYDGMNDAYLLLGGERYPSQPLSSPADFSMHLSQFMGKALVGPCSNATNYSGVPFASYSTVSGVINSGTGTVASLGGGIPRGSFMFGYDLEHAPGEFAYNGYDASTGNTNIVVNGKRQNTAGLLTVITHHDITYYIDPLTRTVFPDAYN